MGASWAGQFCGEFCRADYVDWRYSYELEKTGPVHIEPTIFVMEVLHEACRLTPNA
jgi:hypothetical protein